MSNNSSCQLAAIMFTDIVGYTAMMHDNEKNADAVLCSCLGKLDEAFHYLEKAITNRIGSIMMFKGDPLFAPLKTDPRFEKIVELVGKVPPIDF